MDAQTTGCAARRARAVRALRGAPRARDAVRRAPESSREVTTAWVWIASAHARTDEFDATAAVVQAERALAGCDDPFTVVVGHPIIHGLVATLRPHDRDQHARLIRNAALRLANPLANPLADAIVGRAVASDRLIAGAVDEAMTELAPALAAARQTGAVGIEADLMVLSLARLASRAATIPRSCSRGSEPDRRTGRHRAGQWLRVGPPRDRAPTWGSTPARACPARGRLIRGTELHDRDREHDKPEHHHRRRLDECRHPPTEPGDALVKRVTRQR